MLSNNCLNYDSLNIHAIIKHQNPLHVFLKNEVEKVEVISWRIRV